MSHLQYFSYPGVGERNRKAYRYSQAVKVGDRIECSGQGTPVLLVPRGSDTFPRAARAGSTGRSATSSHSPNTTLYDSHRMTSYICSRTGGWNPENGEYSTDTNTQIDQAFKNVDLNLKDAGGKGWEQVRLSSLLH